MIREFVLREWLYLRSRWATPAWLDALSYEHKKIVATGPFPRRLRRLAAAHVGMFSWVMVPHEGNPEIHNGSMFLLDCGQGPFLVTAGHVYTGYLAQRDSAKRNICQIGNLEFHAEDRLIDLQKRPDIATFRVTDHEIQIIGKQIVTHTAASWPWIVQLAGVITQAHSNENWEQVIAATAAHIRPDGRILHQVLA
ncbi:MAG: hypothetical protein HY322_00825 [Betaproteobacteria bacterium]|nr:hypothetical protein [Betaproteobacteria bacterium]